ncbi:uncharacterized protein EI90DRAFT_3000001 [Cantharellus anzutake]|uniref:uncharacterized protein n=1 Tax=Cantharellus anzutake TaxID=1750568 RepID=UPI0019056942|nr:uncharacterized protein EI90DRAFT_3000001 [Cantharellus anzutake]KAF8325165.1 hypothetical protein EI90DRAFT_3000001 [Cantharellus anzutake]
MISTSGCCFSCYGHPLADPWVSAVLANHAEVPCMMILVPRQSAVGSLFGTRLTLEPRHLCDEHDQKLTRIVHSLVVITIGVNCFECPTYTDRWGPSEGFASLRNGFAVLGHGGTIVIPLSIAGVSFEYKPADTGYPFIDAYPRVNVYLSRHLHGTANQTG